MVKGRKSPLLAALASFLIAGLGQLYLGMFVRAISFFVLEVFTAVLAFKVHSTVGSFLNFLVSVWAAFDAYGQAKKVNRKIVLSKKDEEENKEGREISVY